MAGEIRPACGYPDRRRIEGPQNRPIQLHCKTGPFPRHAWRALVHFHRTVGTATFRRREARAGALWFHFEQATIAYALNPRRSPCPPDVTAVHDLEGHDLLARAGESLKIEGQPMYLSL